MCGAVRASCSGGTGAGRHRSCRSPDPSGLGGHKLWPLPGPVTTSSHQRPWNVTGNPTAQRSACHRPALGASLGSGKAAAADQSVLPALEEAHPRAGAPHTLLPGGFLSPDGSRPPAKPPCLLSHVLCPILGVLIVTGDLSLAHTPLALPGCPRARQGGKASVQLPASASPSNKASKYTRGHSVRCPRGPGACDGPRPRPRWLV